MSDDHTGGLGSQRNAEAMEQAVRGQQEARDWPMGLVRKENEACAALAESHGFEHLAKLIRARLE